MVLLGNKSDIKAGQFSKEKIEKYVSEKKLSNYEVSAKNGEGIEKAMVEMVKDLMKIHPKGNHFEGKSQVIEDLKKHRGAIMLRTGAETSMDQGQAKKGCC